MENWRKFCKEILQEGPVFNMPSGNSKESEEYRKMIKRKEAPGLDKFYVVYSDEPSTLISEKDFLKYITIFSKEEPDPETLRNTVRYLVKRYCKNKTILSLFNELEKLKSSEVSNRLLKLTGKSFIERWHQKPSADALGTYSDTINDDTGSSITPPTIDIYSHSGWLAWNGWDRFVKSLSPFVRTHISSDEDPLRTRSSRKYKMSDVRNFNKFLNVMRALWVSITYVHELAHATDPDRKSKDWTVEASEMYATSETMLYIRNLKKGILKDIFETELPGNFKSWGVDKPTVPINSKEVPILSIMNKKNPKRILSKEIAQFLDWIFESEKEYHHNPNLHN